MYMYNEEIKGHIKKNLPIKYKQFININYLIQNNKVKRSDNISVHLFKLFYRYTRQAVTLMSIFNMNCLSSSIQEVSRELPRPS